MVNSSQLPYFILTGYIDMGSLKYLSFVIVLLLYIMIVTSNALLIVSICINRSLHQPMYMFLCNLLVNQLYGSAGLFPFLLQQITSETHTMTRSLCYLQIYCFYSYSCGEFCNLAVMSYDRYLAICCPLYYKSRMTFIKVALLITAVWLYSSLETMGCIVLSSSLVLCGNKINKVYCDNYPLVKMACSDTTVQNVYGLLATILAVVLPLISILVSYIKIFRVCLVGSKQTRQKAVSTCIPHIASLINFSFACFFEIVQSRFNMSSVPRILRIFLSLYFLIVQPIFNPFIHGLRLSVIRNTLLSKILALRQTCLLPKRQRSLAP